MGSVKDLIGHASASSIEVVVEGLEQEGIAHMQPLVERITAQGGRTLFVLKGQGQLNGVLDVIRAAKATLISVTPHQSSLEDLFMKEVHQQGVRSES